MAVPPTLIVTPIETPKPEFHDPVAHHIGNPPTSFQNPWPSFKKHSGFDALSTRFGRSRNFVPVPSREELVHVRSPPDWGANCPSTLKATWIGHASFLVETAALPGAKRGVRIFFDPVFSERTSPSKWVGPKRYTPTPCDLKDVPDVDLVVISHNHYDHLDLDTITEVYARRKANVHFFCALGNKAWFVANGVNVDSVTELDWWSGVRIDVADVGAIRLICTPAQHFSGRGLFDMGSSLWCSWVLEEIGHTVAGGEVSSAGLQGSMRSSIEPRAPRRLYFAGDTGYRYVPAGTTPENEAKLPRCPAFSDIGKIYGPFDLALLPIGLYLPRQFMSSVHCAPEETACLHKDIRSKKSIGMHWGTVRGGISAQYEDVREPPRRWREVCERNGLRWGEEVALCDIGETVIVD